MLEHNLINAAVAAVLLLLLSFAGSNHGLIVARTSLVSDAISGAYQQRLLENQVAARNWRDLRSMFSVSIRNRMDIYEVTSGELITEDLLPDLSPERIRYKDENKPDLRFGNIITIQKDDPDSRSQTAFIPLGGSYQNIVLRFKIKANPFAISPAGSTRPRARQGELTIGFWHDSEDELTSYSFGLNRGQKEIAFTAAYSPFNKTQFESISFPGSVTPDEEGYIDVEILAVDEQVSLFINNRATSENNVSERSIYQSYNSISLNINGYRDRYSIKDFTIASLETE